MTAPTQPVNARALVPCPTWCDGVPACQDWLGGELVGVHHFSHDDDEPGWLTSGDSDSGFAYLGRQDLLGGDAGAATGCLESYDLELLDIPPAMARRLAAVLVAAADLAERPAA